MRSEFQRLNRQLEREEKVRATRRKVGTAVIALLLLVVLVSLLVQKLMDGDGENIKILTEQTEQLTEANIEEESEETETLISENGGEVIAGNTVSLNSGVDFENLSVQLEDVLEGHSGSWSIYVRDLGRDASLLINNESMYAASLIKLYVMMSAYENYDTLVSNYCSHYSAGESTAKAKIDDWLYTMIVYSRNESYNELVRLHGSNHNFVTGCLSVDAYISQNGFASTGIYTTLHPSDSSYSSTGGGDNHTTVKDCGTLLEQIYNGTCISEQASMSMLSLLLQQDVTTKIPAGIPDGIAVANKTGDTDNESHDVAIVYGEKTDYILCVMSTDVEDMGAGNAGSLIKKISALVYEYLN